MGVAARVKPRPSSTQGVPPDARHSNWDATNQVPQWKFRQLKPILTVFAKLPGKPLQIELKRESTCWVRN
jgi:hypothetical protein